MRMKIEFSMDNDAFRDDYLGEIHRLLARIVIRVADREVGGKTMDSNGNAVGTWEILE